MKNILIICTTLLAGCAGLGPISGHFPDAPDVLMQKCVELETIDKPKVLLSEFTTIIVKNYSKYHLCSSNNDAWQEWYTEQKKIYDEINAK